MAREKDVFDRLQSEHELVSSLFEKLLDGDASERRRVLRQLNAELLSHAKAEEETVYPALAESADTDDKVQDAYTQHSEAESLLEELLALPVDDERWEKKLKELQETVELHVEEEEGDLIPAARNELDDAQIAAIGEDYAEAKERFMEALSADRASEVAATTGLPELDEMTKAQLYELARDKEIEGRSKMTKEQLAEELRHN